MWRIIIRRKLFSLFIGRKPTSWPANNYLKPTNNGLLMRNFVQLCLAAVWLQIIFCSCVNKTSLLLIAIALAWKMADRFAPRRYSLKNKLCDRMIKQLLDEDEVEQYFEICQWRADQLFAEASWYVYRKNPAFILSFIWCQTSIRGTPQFSPW